MSFVWGSENVAFLKTALIHYKPIPSLRRWRTALIFLN
jgi:hypothetical protein